MGNKNKTISFRVSEDAFEALRDIAEERDISLSAVFRNYVDQLVAHDGQVRVVPEHEYDESTAAKESFPPKVEVPKSFVREHERLELEAEHLREQLNEYKQYVTQLSQELEDQHGEEVIQLEDLDETGETTIGGNRGSDDEPWRLG
jgi:predicted transcriptional regulator